MRAGALVRVWGGLRVLLGRTAPRALRCRAAAPPTPVMVRHGNSTRFANCSFAIAAFDIHRPQESKCGTYTCPSLNFIAGTRLGKCGTSPKCKNVLHLAASTMKCTFGSGCNDRTLLLFHKHVQGSGPRQTARGPARPYTTEPTASKTRPFP